MADPKSVELFKMLAEIQKLGGKSTKVLEEKRINAVEPDKSLLYKTEEDFVDGYEMADPSGHKITLQSIWDAFVDGENVLLSGPTGSGKSTIAFHLVDEANESTRVKNRAIWEENKKRLTKGAKEDELESYIQLPYPVEHLSCNAETRAAEIIGDIDLVYDDAGNRRPVIRWGHVIRAWTEGQMLIAEEIDMPDPGVWAGTHMLFDGRTIETDIFLNGVQHIKKHPRFRLIATANTLLQGENAEEFAGTQVQNNAWINRFGFTVTVDYMKPQAEASLIQRKSGTPKDLAEKLVTCSAKSRESYKEGAVNAPISTRDMLAWAREIKRREKREGIKHTDSNHWNSVVVPAAWPSFVCRQPDQATREMYMTFLSLR